MELNSIIHGDCLEVMKEIPDNSIDAIITDPPYALGFMGKEWDTFGANLQKYQEWTRRWAVEALRVLKPGGHLLSFGGIRTYHRLTCGIEDAGFEIRDCIMWVYGSGFPKSLDISKAIDKKRGIWRGRAQSVISNNISMEGPNYTRTDKGVPVTKEAKQWKGWGTALKPAVEPIVVARKPLSEKNVALNVLKWGTGGLNIDECRIGVKGGVKKINIKPRSGGFQGKGYGCNGELEELNKGRFPANLILDEKAAEILDMQSGKSRSSPVGFKSIGWKHSGNTKNEMTKLRYQEVFNDFGGPSRFFKQINFKNYCSLCYNICTKVFNEKDKIWRQLFVNNAEKNLRTIRATTESIAQENVPLELKLKLAQIVKYVGNLCDLCVINFVQEVVKIKHLDFNPEELEVTQGFIQNSKKYILLQNLVQFVEQWDNIDTTPTTKNLLKLLGSVNRVTTNYIQEIEKSEPKRFLYQPKASKSERHMGLEREEAKIDCDRNPECYSANVPFNRSGNPKFNYHPTIKPIRLMEYLVKLVTPPNGVVLDPFAGSGSTLIACKKLGVRFIGIEKEEEYVEIAKKRLLNERQLSLFE